MARAWFDDLPTGSTSEMLNDAESCGTVTSWKTIKKMMEAGKINSTTNDSTIWELSGRAEALHGIIRRKRRMELRSIDLGEVEAVMGWDECCRKCGHPANEE